jgi:hypothetical protein
MRIKRSLFTFLLSTLALLTLVRSASAWPAADYSNYWVPGVISIVWPHDGQGNPTAVAQSRAVNVSVWPNDARFCDQPPTFVISHRRMRWSCGVVRIMSHWNL